MEKFGYKLAKGDKLGLLRFPIRKYAKQNTIDLYDVNLAHPCAFIKSFKQLFKNIFSNTFLSFSLQWRAIYQ